jgi:uncharacterized protein
MLKYFMSPEYKKEETIHLHRPKSRFAKELWIIFIPSTIFLLTLAVSYKYLPPYLNKIFGNSQPEVGDQINTDIQKYVTINGKSYPVTLADTPEKTRLGLSGRESLDPGTGMFFDLGHKDARPAFWMKDMKFDIEIIWINDDKITQITHAKAPNPGAKDTELPKYIPTTPVDYVLEVTEGFSQTEGVKVGDSVSVN